LKGNFDKKKEIKTFRRKYCFLKVEGLLPATDYPRASRSFPRIAGSGNEIAALAVQQLQISAASNVRFFDIRYWPVTAIEKKKKTFIVEKYRILRFY
jgi:hypothetical protein